jgi:hypothetical protein
VTSVLGKGISQYCMHDKIYIFHMRRDSTSKSKLGVGTLGQSHPLIDVKITNTLIGIVRLLQ